MCAVVVLVGNIGKGGFVGQVVGAGLYGVIVGMINDYRELKVKVFIQTCINFLSLV